jgi:hypothetical protein
MSIMDGPIHGVGHGELFLAVFVVGQSCGDSSARPEDFGGRQHSNRVLEKGIWGQGQEKDQ